MSELLPSESLPLEVPEELLELEDEDEEELRLLDVGSWEGA